MKLFLKMCLTVSCLLIIFGLAYAQDNKGTLIVEVKGFENSNGKARILLFKTGQEDYFPMEYTKAFKKIIIPIINNKVEYKFQNIPYDDYAVSVHHDADGNGKVNTNWIGIPNEGLGASNDAKGNFGPPSFDDAKITLKSSTKTIVINMVN